MEMTEKKLTSEKTEKAIKEAVKKTIDFPKQSEDPELELKEQQRKMMQKRAQTCWEEIQGICKTYNCSLAGQPKFIPMGNGLWGITIDPGIIPNP